MRVVFLHRNFQHNGCHILLIQKRIHSALKSPCKLFVGQAHFRSVSQNNMEHCGMNIAYAKSIWTLELPPLNSLTNCLK
ncbi:acetyltransferase [Bacillus cereus]|nr:acetyltransferase [Bacillus sp. AFS023182]PGY01578.1 acetyltransferase [Bacillus cereus]